MFFKWNGSLKTFYAFGLKTRDDKMLLNAF